MKVNSIALRTGAAVSALALALLPVLALGSGASGSGNNNWTPVGQGLSVANLPGAVAFGSTPASTPEQVAIILQERNEGQLESAVENGISNDLSVSQFASTYGQTSSNIGQLQSLPRQIRDHDDGVPRRRRCHRERNGR